MASVRSSHPIGQVGPRRRSLLFPVAVLCVAAIVLETAAVTGVFGLANGQTRSTGPSGPDLNPYGERIVAIGGNITYAGPARGYFPALNGTSLCPHLCPETPLVWGTDGSNGSPEIGVRFFYNVTNVGNRTANLSLPVLTTGGPDPTLFVLETYCCYSAVNQPYGELLTVGPQFTAGTTIGLEEWAFTTSVIPAVTGGNYTLYANFTAT